MNNNVDQNEFYEVSGQFRIDLWKMAEEFFDEYMRPEEK
jgi:hypothetical protein